MKQTLLTICLILFALPSLGQTTFSGGNISGGKIGNNSSSSNQRNNLLYSDLEKGVMYQLSSEYFIKQEPKKLFSFFPHQYSNISENHHLVISVYGSEDLSNDGINEIFGAIYVFDENDEIVKNCRESINAAHAGNAALPGAQSDQLKKSKEKAFKAAYLLKKVQNRLKTDYGKSWRQDMNEFLFNSEQEVVEAFALMNILNERGTTRELSFEIKVSYF